MTTLDLAEQRRRKYFAILEERYKGIEFLFCGVFEEKVNKRLRGNVDHNN